MDVFVTNDAVQQSARQNWNCAPRRMFRSPLQKSRCVTDGEVRPNVPLFRSVSGLPQLG
jgi:hypothetical protein